MFKINLVLMAIIASACASNAHKKEMLITKVEKQQSFDDKSPVFSGNVKVQMLFTDKDHYPSKLTGADVEFSPKARSAWHTHPKGQLLVVKKGEGYVQQWGQKARKILSGDVVWTPPGVKHWHGACEDKSMLHTALQEKKKGSNVVWMEKVSDETYQQAVRDAN